MRYAIFGDVHSNLEALEAVFDDMDRQDIDEYFCLGDVVGYGADPEPVMELVRERASTIVAGNHDYAIAGKLTLDHFNVYARKAAEWTIEQLSDDHLAFLNQLPLLDEVNGLTLAHATIKSPEKFEYILTAYDAHLNFEEMETDVGFFGHSHIPVNFVLRNNVLHNNEQQLTLAEDEQIMTNVGSVGQPRDEDPRSSYCIYDDEERSIEIRRIEYDIDTAANKIYEVGLPKLLGERLYRGK